MPYRVIITGGGDAETPNGSYVTTGVEGDYATYDNYDDAMQRARSMRRIFPDVSYVVVGQWNARDWDAIAQRYGAPPAATPVETSDDEDDEDEDIPECGICCDDHYTDDHISHYCSNCDWTCDVHDCRECVSYGPDGDMCDSCAEAYYEDEGGGGTGSPGLSLRRCDVCDSYDVHHDDIAEEFVCDHRARLLVEQRRPVTLAHELPTLRDAISDCVPRSDIRQTVEAVA